MRSNTCLLHKQGSMHGACVMRALAQSLINLIAKYVRSGGTVMSEMVANYRQLLSRCNTGRLLPWGIAGYLMPSVRRHLLRLRGERPLPCTLASSAWWFAGIVYDKSRSVKKHHISTKESSQKSKKQVFPS